MKSRTIAGYALTVCGILASLVAFSAETGGSAGGTKLFVFDNGVGRGKWTPQEQAAALKELGYDGISYNYTNNEDLQKRMEAFKAVNLPIFGLYCGAN